MHVLTSPPPPMDMHILSQALRSAVSSAAQPQDAFYAKVRSRTSRMQEMHA